MKTIWKYQLEVEKNQTLVMPEGAEILTVQLQYETACIWAVVDPEAKSVPRTFELIGTGHDFKLQNYLYIGTFQVDGGNFIFHLFEVLKP